MTYLSETIKNAHLRQTAVNAHPDNCDNKCIYAEQRYTIRRLSENIAERSCGQSK